ncbi:MAG: T9SS type A sorting domain-containing protein, partial [Ignavibacteria bacterium]|nr:T9SS type A sorting domain-containing protein [Ignavibacteria bacterium]
VRRLGEGRVQAYGAYAGDFNGDGFGDLSIPNELSDDVRLFLNDGTGRYSSFTVIPLPGGSVPSPNEGADFDNDGLLDLAVGNTGNDSVTVLLGNGGGGFVSSANYRASAAVRGLAVGDLDGDGDPDIVTANRAGNNVSVLLNLGSGTFASPVQLEASGNQETACALADANHDGILDLFVGTFASNEIILMLGDGNGSFALSSKMPAGGRPWMIAVGDVNGDTNVDVVSANSFTGNASVLLGSGTGMLDSAKTYFSGDFVIAIDLGDLDGDGDLDMVTSNFGSADWRVYENAGNGTFVNTRRLRASTAGSCATLHDRDGDGDLDITGIDEIDDLIFLFENTGPVSVGEERAALSFSLHQNFPNPFNGGTRIAFSIPREERVTLTVHDVLGRYVRTLYDGRAVAGEHEVTLGTEGLASGIYFYRMSAGGYTETKKFVLMR